MKSFRKFSQIATLKGAFQKDGRKLVPSDLSIIENGSIVFDQSEIKWVGPDSEMPGAFQSVHSEEFAGKTLVPELVDSHTHAVFGGDRSEEYSQRLNGVDYTVIAKKGGGILTTMQATRQQSIDELIESTSQKIESILANGVGTIEIKSGYGLSFEKEYELSHVIATLKAKFRGKAQIFNTFMAAHAVPRPFKSSKAYMDQVVLVLLDKLAGENIVDAVDIFHEQNYFDGDDVSRLFSRAKELGIQRKIHADEFNDNGGAKLAVEHEALSADHLLKVSKEGIKALANSNTVATLLPGTGFFLGKPQAKARELLDAGAKVAIASDYNPGSCHCDNLILLASIAAPQYGMNMAELWGALTLNAAHALGLKKQGALVEGLRPRFSLFDAPSIDHITYHWGKNLNFC